MLLPVVIILVSARPAFFAQVNKRELMEGTLQKYVEEFMAFYGNHTRTSESKPPHRMRTVFSQNKGSYNQRHKSRQKDQPPHNDISKKKKKLIISTETKKRQNKIRPKSQIKAISQRHKPHGHAYEFDGAFDPFPLWEYSGWLVSILSSFYTKMNSSINICLLGEVLSFGRLPFPDVVDRPNLLLI